MIDVRFCFLSFMSIVNFTVGRRVGKGLNIDLEGFWEKMYGFAFFNCIEICLTV